MGWLVSKYMSLKMMRDSNFNPYKLSCEFGEWLGA